MSPLDEEAAAEDNTADLDLSDEDDLGDHGDNEEDDLDIEDVKVTDCTQPLYVLPLYSLLSTQKQAQVS